MKDPKEVAREILRQQQENISSVADDMAFGVIGKAVLAMRRDGADLTWTTLAEYLRSASEEDRIDVSWQRAALKAIEGD